MKSIRSLFKEILWKNYWANLTFVFIAQAALALLVAFSVLAFAQHLMSDYISVVIQKTEGSGYQVLLSNQMESLIETSRSFAPIKFDIEIYHDGRPSFLSKASDEAFRVPINYKFQVNGIGSPYDILISANVGPFIIINVVVFLGLFLLVSVHFWFRAKKTEKSFNPIITDIVSLINKIEMASHRVHEEIQPEKKIETAVSELAELQKAFDRFVSEINQQRENVRRLLYAEAEAALATQVAHDIRSPLSALNMVSASLTEVSEEKRQIIRMVSTRINDIANNLLRKGQAKTESLRPTDLSKLVNELAEEKRIQFSNYPGVQIQVEAGAAIWCQVHVADLSRALSNLVNNAVEAIESKAGRVLIEISQDSVANKIRISDSGKGIPAEILTALGQVGVTHGKNNLESGSGLGVSQAKQAVESMGGEFKIESTVGRGTVITLSLPK